MGIRQGTAWQAHGLLRVIGLAAGLILAAGTWGATVEFHGIVNPEPPSQLIRLNGNDIEVIFQFEIDPAAPAAVPRLSSGWLFPELIRSVSVSVFTAVLAVPGPSAELRWLATDLATPNYLPQFPSDSLFLGMTGPFGCCPQTHMLALFAQPWTPLGPFDEAVMFAQFPGVPYHLETVIAGVISSEALAGAGAQQPQLDDFLRAFAVLDPFAASLITNDLTVFFRNSDPQGHPDGPLSL